jgi:AcrR family transcriptional regulator
MDASGEAPNPRKELVREELITKAAEVFEKRGFAQTRIGDIAQELSLGRSSLYHYFRSKEQILAALVEEHTIDAAADLERLISQSGATATERLRLALSNSILKRIAGGARIRVLDQLETEMPPDLKQTFNRARRRVLDLYTGLIEEGIEHGEFRAIDARTAALAVLGIASWTSWWYSPKGKKSPEELTDILVDIALAGIAQPIAGGAKPVGLNGAIGALKDTLAALEKLAR